MSEVWDFMVNVFAGLGLAWVIITVVGVIRALRAKRREKHARFAEPIWPLVEFDHDGHHWVLPHLATAPTKIARLAQRQEDPLQFVTLLGEWGGPELAAYLEDNGPFEISAFLSAWTEASKGIDE